MQCEDTQVIKAVISMEFTQNERILAVLATKQQKHDMIDVLICFTYTNYFIQHNFVYPKYRINVGYANIGYRQRRAESYFDFSTPHPLTKSLGFSL